MSAGTVKVSCTGTDLVDPADLAPFQGAFKGMAEKDRERLKKQLASEGVTAAATVWKHQVNGKFVLSLLDGHQRQDALLALRKDGWTIPPIPINYADCKNEAHARRVVMDLASTYGSVNQDELVSFTELAGLQLPELNELYHFPDIDLGAVTRSVGAALMASGDSKIDDMPPMSKKIISKVGDVWLLGKHRLICGDSFDHKIVAKLMGREKVDAVFTSPPYNADIAYAEYKDKKSKDEYLGLMALAFKTCFNAMKSGRMIGWNLGVTRKTCHIEQAQLMLKTGFVFHREIIWKKAGVARPIWQFSDHVRKYTPNYQFEVIYMMSKGEMETGEGTTMPDAASSDVWQIAQSQATADIAGTEADAENAKHGARQKAEHPAAFPVALPRTAILCMTGKNEIVYDPFAGAGSTLLACEQTGRIARLSELTPIYCDLIVKRWEKLTGKRATKEAK